MPLLPLCKIAFFPNRDFVYKGPPFFSKYNKTPNRRTISCAHLRPRIFRLRYAHFIYGRAPQGYYRTLSAKPVSLPAAIQVFKVQRESKLYLAFSPINTETFLKILHFKIKKCLALSADYPGIQKGKALCVCTEKKKSHFKNAVSSPKSAWKNTTQETGISQR